jgi:hypothetical protein
VGRPEGPVRPGVLWEACGQAGRGRFSPCQPVREAQSMGFPRERAQSIGFPCPSTARGNVAALIVVWGACFHGILVGM